MREAILATTLLVLAGGISPAERPPEPLQAEIVEETPAPIQIEEEPVTEPVKDPQGCEPEQYWAKEPPHDCIDKPVGGSASNIQPVTISGNKETWLRASGIPESEWWAVDNIVSGESGWDPLAVNPSSGACGLGQQLPCGKWSGDWREPIGALKNMNIYVLNRYGSWSYAVEWRNCVGWCVNTFKPSLSFDKDHTWY